MSTRTDHSGKIRHMRDQADAWERSHVATGSAMLRDLVLLERAAADLLELHDSTGLNLHNAPNLLALVEHVMGSPVEPNGV